MALVGILDEPLSQFIRLLQMNKIMANTAIVLCSDHGIHYGARALFRSHHTAIPSHLTSLHTPTSALGPYFRSPSGQRERSEPLLYVRLPDGWQVDEVGTMQGLDGKG